MSGLSRVCVVILDRRGHLGSIGESILGALGVKRLRVVDAPADVLPLMARMRPDLILINGVTENAFWAESVHAIRNSEKSPDPFTPLILMTPDASRQTVVSAMRQGIDSVLLLPVKPPDLHRHIVLLAQAQRTFVRLPTYFGPCRRRFAEEMVAPGFDRRTGEAGGIDLRDAALGLA